VLVHGAFAESASWNGVIANLERRGYPVIAVANQLRGLRLACSGARRRTAPASQVSGSIAFEPSDRSFRS
jgi:hypothetical protein